MEVCFSYINLRYDLFRIFKSIFEAFTCFFARAESLVHFVKSDAKHNHVEKDNFCEVVHSFVEGELRRDLSHFAQALLLDDYSVQSNLKPVAKLTKSFKEDEPS